MLRYLSRALFPCLALSAALPAMAEQNLGIIGGTLRLGFSDQMIEGGFVEGGVDVAITEYHGTQIDLQYEERSNGGIGRLGAFVFMTPREGHKYGLSLMLADKNNVSSTYGQIGAVGMLQVHEAVNLELRGGMGLSADSDLDWITAGIGAHWQVSARTRLYGHYDIAEFDEQDFSALSHEVTIGAAHRLSDRPASVFAEASRDWLSGRNGTGKDTTIRAGISISLGRTANNQPRFRVSDPMRQLLRRGLY